MTMQVDAWIVLKTLAHPIGTDRSKLRSIETYAASVEIGSFELVRHAQAPIRRCSAHYAALRFPKRPIAAVEALLPAVTRHCPLGFIIP